MHEFKYKNNHLYCESIKIEDIAKKVATPFYLYSYKTIIDHYMKLKSAFKSLKPLICYSAKANSNLSVLRALIRQGAGVDVVSGGELFKAQKAKANPKRIVYASVGKTEEEIRAAIKAGILFFNVESIPELKLINNVARDLKKKTAVCIRINPDVEPKTHELITTGKLINKFGVDFETAEKIFFMPRVFDMVEIKGLHLHIGSQIITSRPFVSAIEKVIRFVDKLKKAGIDIEYINIGGGLGIIYNKEKPQTAKEFAKAVIPLLKKKGLKLILEPGRFIVGNSGVLITKVIYVKKTKIKKFVIVDAAMNDLIRPALYNAYHEILPLAQGKSLRRKYDIVGPVCESSDFFAKDRALGELKPGNLLAIMGVGAYGYTMSSNYNARLRPAEVMIIKDKIYTIKDRESYKDLIKNERLPRVLA